MMPNIDEAGARARIRRLIHIFCFSDNMRYNGCANCPIDCFDVCGEHPPMKRLHKAEKAILKLMEEGGYGET